MDTKSIQTQIDTKAMLDSAPEAVAVISPEGICLYANRACEAILGYPPTEFVGMNLLERIHEEEEDDILTKQKEVAFMPGAVRQALYRYKMKNGEYKWLKATATNHITTPGIGGILIFAHDISEEEHRVIVESRKVKAKHLEEIARLQEQLNSKQVK